MSREPRPPAFDLTFEWGQRPRSIWRLLPAFLLCVAVLALLTLVFKSASPPPVRTQRLSQSVLLLDPSNPLNQIVLNRAQDRGALILGPESLEEIASSSPPLLPVFRPSFSGFQLRLKETYITRDTTAPPRLFQSGDLALPRQPPPPLPSPPNASSTRAGAKPWRLTAHLHGPLASRPLRSSPDFASLRPQDLSRLRFQIAVKPDGRTTLVIPLTSSVDDREFVPALQQTLSSFRFEPLPGAPIQWGEVSFSWSLAPPARP